MPSCVFPGVDPYVEGSGLWWDLHSDFTTCLKSELNRALPDRSFAISARRIEFDPAEEVEVPFIEIRDSRSGHELLTVIEVLSPRNKRRIGDANRDNYARKREDLLRGRVSLVEIDLLRSGDRGVLGEAAAKSHAGLSPEPEYAVLVSRGHATPRRPMASLFPAYIDRPLPVIPVPLRQGEPELPLDLQAVFEQAYAAGPYRRYFREYPPQPEPPLPAERAEWLKGVLAA